MIAADVASAEQTELQEIVVTARKRVENLQEVATSIDALDQSLLSKRFDADLRDFANAAPNVVIDDLGQGPGSPAAIAIRGVGTTDVEKSFDPTAGVVVDGIFIGVNSGAMIKAIDIQSIELLNGPQGTLFGRNSIAGVLNITRSKPSTEEVSGQARVGYGNYNDTEMDGYVNLPVSDKFAFKIGVAKRSRDGYFYDATTKKNVGAVDYKSLSPSFLWKPMEGLELTYRYDQTWQTQDTDVQDNMAQPGQVWCFYYHQCAQSLTSPQSGNRYVVLGQDAPMPAFFNTQMHNLGAVWDIGSGYKINYLFGYFKTAEGANQDWDGTPLALYETLRPARYYQHSNELRLSYGGDGPLSYTVGLYEWNSGYRIDLNSSIGFVDFLYGLPAGTVVTVLQTVQQKTDSYAGFFEGDYKFADQWTLTLGGRYTDDKKSSGLIDPTMPQLATKGNLDNPFTDSWKQFTPKASIKYQFTPDVMVYGLYSEGFRAGGFDGRPGTYDAAAKPYNPEKVDNFEIGWKSELFEHRLRINGSIFVMKYKDKQEEESVPTTVGTGQETLVINASSATIKGAEIDAVANIAPGFTLSGNVGYLNARYDKLADPVTGANLSYLHLRRSPPMTATISPYYEWTLGPGKASIQADYHYIGPEELTFLNSPQSSNRHQDLLNASVNYTIDKTRISVYGLNLTKDDAWEQAYDVGSSTSFAGLWTYATPRPPLTYGMRVTQSF